VATGIMTWERAKTAQLLEGGIRFFLTAALTASHTPGGFAPFALGCVAAAGEQVGVSLAGAAMGALLFLPFAEALPFLAEALLIVTCAAAFRDTGLAGKPLFLPLVAGGLVLAVGGIYAAQSLEPAGRLAGCVAAAGLTAASAWFFRSLWSEDTARRQESILFLAAALLLAVQEVKILQLSVGRTLLAALLLYVSYERGALTGATVGLGLGLTADLCAGTGSGLFTAGFGLAGLAAGSRVGGHRMAAAAVFLGAAAVSMLPSADPLAQPLLLETALGSAVFLLLPRRAFGGKRVRRAEVPETAVSRRIREQMLKTAAALRDLYDCMGRGPAHSTEENPAVIFDRAAEKVCRDCGLCGLCWQKEYTGTFNALNDATPFLLERGRAMQKDFPGYFVQRCIHLSEFIIAVNGELSAFLLRRQYRRQLEETRRSAQGQYAQLSELLTATAAGLGETAVPDGGSISVGAAIRAKEGESVCGDTVMSFRTEAGRWCLLLADGMGSGEPARKESALTCRLLRQFLEAGIEPEAALKTLNAAMALRGAETGSFTTVDLCICDGGAGEAVFYKYGAAPSYIKKGGVVRRVTGASLPVGLRGAPALPDVTRVALEPGSFAVLISDGVADADRDDWLQDLLAGWPGEDPQELADLILAESIRRERLRDDCGVEVLYRPQEKKAVAAV